MDALGRKTVRVGITVGLSLGAIVGLVGCSQGTDAAEGSHEFAVETTNGLMGVNGLYGTNGINGVNGINAVNGISGVNGIMGTNGISAVNGISGINGLSETSGLMTTDAGRKTVAYITKCALASGDTLIKKDQNGVSYTFAGGLGLCPAWKNGGVHGSSYRTCQNMVSACLMAHINTSGVHVPLWLDSESTMIGWGTSPSYPKQEGTFFGNMIETGDLSQMGMTGVTGPATYFCEGAGITAGVVSGRLTSGATNVPYKNPYGDKVQCSSGQTAAGPISAGQTAPDGYKQACANGYCFQNGEPITVWRNPTYTPVFDQVYRYTLVPTSATTKSMDIASDGVTLQQYTIPSGGPADDQKFAILQSGSNWKIVLKSNTNKCIGPDTNGVTMKVQDCNGSTAQSFTISANANTGAFTVKNVALGTCLEMPYNNTADGAVMDLYSCWSGSNQMFNLKSSY